MADIVPTLEMLAECVHAEARHIDDADWEGWLDRFAPDCIFWVPTWRTDGVLVDDPGRQVSHIYSRGVGALRDRVHRLASGLSAATTPMQRTTHILSRSFALPSCNSDRAVRTAFSSHVYFPREHVSHVFFGDYEHRFVEFNGAWKIAAKKIVLKNDHIPTMIDFYFL